MAVEKLITQHIDTWTSALQTRSTAGRGSKGKIDLYGIKKLRELILELAVRGKLVPQDPNDEPASELLKRIAAEKAELVKQGKIKKQKPLPEISEDEKPFELPSGWEWVRLGDVFKVSSGDGLTSSQMNTSGNIPVYGGNGINGYHDSFNINKKTLVIGRVGFYCGSVHVTSQHAWVTDNAFVVEFSESNLDLSYAELLLKITNLKENENATAQPVISGRKIYPIVLAIPPYREQQKVVKKVYELIGLCDQLEQQSLTSLDAHSQLVETLLSTLTASQNAEELAENWARISQHFDTLFTTEASIDSLKQTILQLAVMGKLVPQDPNDEPASELLKRIEREKAQLVKEGKIKKQKPLPPISEDEKPFELPVGWEWCRIMAIAQVGTGSTPSRDNPDYWSEPEFNWVTSGETSSPFIIDTAEKVSMRAVKETNVSIYPPGTLIIAMYGQGKTRGQITELRIAAGTNQACAAIQLFESNEFHRRYIKFFFEKSYDDLRSHAAGGAQPNLNLAKVSNTLIPIPPLAEQIEIAAKIDELFVFCDSLKSRLQSAQQTQLHLADALTDAALN
ncbi:TPA: restriction endonuclease subunit S [Yersinia enterocolitica]|uniref:restriction endonuclease subunit S n=1 Tax=Yersinia enterocolitica TaxID=630 RepID=UPI0005FCF498|nr:restriction endonuclease subunit S [Yersinia enterocolitica]EKN5930975.1 restriction endonuclease subunit S [Yersinia enterocolitica]CRE57013.1 EcoKI restriction-modification system protein HsdS [Yersinia enterocolitica]HDL6627883.1 restriction endonuclease subunit S [Yersinia enterocolitica]HDL6653830.1 restriction endonuclease subunit S [Yersinia enterocolitica]HDL6679947.1 restriction endonuclease subunit S [Yersinia enterocolitica]